jgi:hypothetical protein
VQRTQIFVELELNDKNKVQRTAISFRFRCAAPLGTSSALFYKYYRDSVAFCLSEMEDCHFSSVTLSGASHADKSGMTINLSASIDLTAFKLPTA